MIISKSKVYELALSSIKEKHIHDFLTQYIPNVSPFVTEYGGKFLINGTIQNSTAKIFPAKSFAVLEWPSIDQFININKDKRILPLVEMRNQYLDFIIEGCFYNVLEDTDFEIPKNKIMNLLLSNRTILDDQNIRLQWINDDQNSELSLNLYFSHNLTKQYDKDEDMEELTIQVL